VTMRSLAQLTYLARASRAIAVQPYESTERILERIAEQRDQRRPSWPYELTAACEEQVHALIGAQWPCDEQNSFDEVWEEALADLAAHGIQAGRGTFGGWDDGDSRLGRVAWCVVRHLRPELIVETGVGHGLTTRLLLEALDRNGSGRLWSIDLPPLVERRFAEETGVAVPERLRERWTLVRGSSRRRLRGLVAELGQVDFFLHDSMHTERNLRFELDQIWPELAPGGTALIDDVEKNVAIGEFLQAHPEARSLIAPSDDGAVLIGFVVKSSRR
jgi:hypothetical protein